MSLLVYLNDDFENGETGYWPNHSGIHCRFLRDVEKQHSKKDHQILIKPKLGMCVVQDQNILHILHTLLKEVLFQKGDLETNRKAPQDDRSS